MELTEKQMCSVDGGISFGLIAGFAAALTFLVGVISGYTNPTRCNN